MDKKELDLERLHQAHAYKINGVHFRRKDNTELMVQNICSTVEINLGTKEYSIGVSCHSLQYWQDSLLPRILTELRQRNLPYSINQRIRVRVFVENAIIYRHSKSDRPEPEFLYEDLK